MRVLLVTETFLPSIDGVVTRLRHLVDHLCAQGHDVEVIAPGLGVGEMVAAGGRRVPIHGAPAVRLPFYSGRPWALPGLRAWLLTRKVVREFEPDIIHAAQPILLARHGVRAARRYRIPIVASFHTNLLRYLETYPRWAWAAPVIRWGIRDGHKDAALTIVTSASTRDELDSLGVERLEVIPRGVDTEVFHPGAAHAAMRARLLGLEQESEAAASGPLLVFVGRLAAEKNVESLEPVIRRHPTAHLAIVGEGPHRSALEAAFAGTRTTFVGPLRGADLAAAYASADAFVFPSTSETLGLVILEAMASGLPVLAARSGPTREQVREGETGFVYANEAELERAIDALHNADVVGPMREEARREAEKYSWSAASEAILELYRKALAGAAVRE